MAKIKRGVGGLFFLLFVISCGSGSSTSPARIVTVTLVPAHEAADVPVAASVTATFSGAITESSSWLSAFTLKKDERGSSLCTAVSYDSASLTATCTHADFTAGSSYTTGVFGIRDASDQEVSSSTATFTTE